MRFKNPGGNLVWESPLIAGFGLFFAYTAYRDGSPALAIIYGSLGLLALLVWFDMKWVVIPLMGYFGLAICAGILLLFVRGFSWLMVVKLIAAGCLVYELWKWRGRADDDSDVTYVEF
jgi:hypothetical protein